MTKPEDIKPVEFKVLIKVDTVAGQTAGGMYLPDSVRTREQMVHDRGILVAVSEMAFGDWTCGKPKIGDAVIFNKYAGSLLEFDTAKGREPYRLCNDKDIAAIIQGAG